MEEESLILLLTVMKVVITLHVAQLEAKEFKVLARSFGVKHEHQNKCTQSTLVAKKLKKISTELY